MSHPPAVVGSAQSVDSWINKLICRGAWQIKGLIIITFTCNNWKGREKPQPSKMKSFVFVCVFATCLVQCTFAYLETKREWGSLYTLYGSIDPKWISAASSDHHHDRSLIIKPLSRSISLLTFRLLSLFLRLSPLLCWLVKCSGLLANVPDLQCARAGLYQMFHGIDSGTVWQYLQRRLGIRWHPSGSAAFEQGSHSDWKRTG